MNKKTECVWGVGSGHGFFLKSNGEYLLVARASSLCEESGSEASRNGQTLTMDLVGIDTHYDIALLRPLRPTIGLTRLIEVVKMRELVDLFGFDKKALERALGNLHTMEMKTERTYRDYTPDVFEMFREDFAALQRVAKNPFGIFSRDQNGNLYDGWSTSARQRLDVPNAWRRLALGLPESNNFFLRGFEVVTYRQKYQQGYTVPRIIELR